jgi:hypothetical protein
MQLQDQDLKMLESYFFYGKGEKLGKRKKHGARKNKKDCFFHCVGVLISPGSWRALSFFLIGCEHWMMPSRDRRKIYNSIANFSAFLLKKKMQGTANVKLKRHGGWNCSKMNQDTCNCPIVWRGNVWKRYPETLDSFKVYRSSRPNPQTWTFHWDRTPRDLTNLKKLELRDIGSHSKLEDFGVPCQVQLEPRGMWTCCPRPCCPRLLRMQMLSLRPDILQQDTPSSCRFLRAEIYIISINFS